jgi:antitoxin HicB
MHYMALFEADGDGFIARFPAIPEIATGGANFDEAFDNANDALEVALLTFAKHNIELPKDVAADAKHRTAHIIHVSASVVAKLEFIAAFRQSGLTRVALAERLGKAETEVRRMLNPYHGTKLAMLETAIGALGKRFVLKVEEAT